MLVTEGRILPPNYSGKGGDVFINTLNKLEDARRALGDLREARDSLSFRSRFNSTINALRAITYALQKEGTGKHRGFDDWYRPKQSEMRSDELLHFIHEARNEDIHEGKHSLQFGTSIGHLSTEQALPSRPPGAKFLVLMHGAFWCVE